MAEWQAAATDAAPYALVDLPGGEHAFLLPDGRAGCSLRNPLKEAALRCSAISEVQQPLLLGVGAGHDLDALARLGVGHVIVVEADRRSMATALERWRRLGRSPGMEISRLIFAPSDKELLGRLTQLLSSEHVERPILFQPHCTELWRAQAPRSAELVEDLQRRRSSARRQEALLTVNAEANRSRLREAVHVADKRGCWSGDTVVVCGAGPGLDADLPHLQTVTRTECRLIAASTALPPLFVAGLRPDLVVATDPSPLLAMDLMESPTGTDMPLVCFPGTSAALVRNWPGPLWLALPAGPGLRDESWEGLRPGQLEAGCGTVAGPALALAAQLSSGRLLLSGVDLTADSLAYAAGVRRPRDLQRPDFAFAQRRMQELVMGLRLSGRVATGFRSSPAWLIEEESA